MVEQDKKELEKQLWNIANALRGNMSADEFRDYILGFIFYKYLSEKMLRYADAILKEDGITFDGIAESSDDGKQYLEAIKTEAIDQISPGWRIRSCQSIMRQLASESSPETRARRWITSRTRSPSFCSASADARAAR